MVVRRWFDAREWLIERDAYVCAAGDVHGSAHRGRRGWVLDVYGVHRPDGVLQRERGCDDDPDGGCAQVGDLEAAILAAQVLGCGARVHGRCVKPTRKNKRSQVHPAGERAQNDHAVRDRVEQLHLHPQAGHRDLPVDRDPGGRHVPDRHIPDHGLRGARQIVAALEIGTGSRRLVRGSDTFGATKCLLGCAQRRSQANALTPRRPTGRRRQWSAPRRCRPGRLSAAGLAALVGAAPS